MAVSKEFIKPGETYTVSGSPRRVIAVRNGHVSWEYADGIERIGRYGDFTSLETFAEHAEPVTEDVCR